MKHCPCEMCANAIDGSICRLNLEAECREGGGYDAWEPEAQPAEIEEQPSWLYRAAAWLTIALCAIGIPYTAMCWIQYWIG